MEANPKNTDLAALLTLLQDENPKVASLAMEQILKLGPLAEKTVADYQEATDPLLRNRIHQLSTILARRKARTQFISGVREETVSLWDGIVAINFLYDLGCRPEAVEEGVRTLRRKLGSRMTTATLLGAFMRDQEFAVPEEDTLDIELYLIERVLESRFGSPPLLCALTRELGRRAGWFSTIVLFEGRYCLVDRAGFLLDPAADWRVMRLRGAEKFHPCARKHVWIGILAQMFLVSLVEGSLRDIHHIGDLLTALNEDALDALPYPLGADA